MTRAIPLILAAMLAAGLIDGEPALARKPEAEAAGGSTRTLYLMLIRQARTDGRARAALAYLDDFDRQYPADREAQILRVNCLLDLGQVDAASAAAARLPSGDRDGEALAARGHVVAAQGNWPQAAAEYGAAHAASPADPLVANALGYAQLRSGQTARAVETLKGAYDLAPADRTIRNNLALALTVAGRQAEAATLIGKVADGAERTRLSGQLAVEARRLGTQAGIEAGTLGSVR